ncbi:MAG: DUF3592 domain-containing protein [Nocardioidaceae bacterium]
MADIVVPIFALVVGLGITLAGSDRTRAAARRYRRGRTWPRVTGTLRSVREEFRMAGDEGTTDYHVKYRFVVPETGQRHNGYSTRGDHRMSVGDDLEVMYDPDDPTTRRATTSPRARRPGRCSATASSRSAESS